MHEHIRIAADKGFLEAQYLLGFLYELGCGVECNLETSVEWYSRAAEAGSALAQLRLAELYAAGRGVPQDLNLAFSWLQKAAELSLPHAQYLLGLRFQKGLGTTRDVEKAKRWIETAANSGSADAAYYLACAARSETQANKQTPEERLHWLERAHALGHIGATIQLAGCFRKGDGVPRDETRAVSMYESASQRGSSAACAILALIFNEGLLGTVPDKTKGAYYRQRFVETRKLERLGRRRYLEQLQNCGDGVDRAHPASELGS